MYIEWFLLDNTLMNYLILRTAGALLARPARQWQLWITAFLCGILAGIAFAAIPLLLTLPGKLLPALLMGLPFYRSKKEIPRIFGCILAASMLIGGGVYGFVLFTGGSMQGGVLFAAPPLRVVLLGAVACCFLPGVIRKWHIRRMTAHCTYPMRMIHKGITYTFRALLDTGNILSEPFSGIPVILLASELMPQGAARPIPCETVTGSGMLCALQPDCLEIYDNGWNAIHALIAASPVKIRCADALIGPAALPMSHIEEKEFPRHEISRVP